MDLVYVLGSGSRWGDNELRYSLRSVEKYLTGYDKIFLVGNKPDWVKNVVHIPKQDIPCKECSIKEKILAACYDYRLSEDFLFLNDDHIFLQKTETYEIKSYFYGTLSEWINRRSPKERYFKCLSNAKAELERFGLPTYHFDIHVPIVYNKTRFIQAMDTYNWNLTEGMVIKSLYGNTFFENPVEYLDCKINEGINLEQIEKRVKDRFCFSFGDKGLNMHLKYFLNKNFLDPSKYE
ncbi:MAG: hypothetical protein IPI90_14195 [Saprospiraceae bacterium]|jgi:hypothetical protein|nr:hypothetical protein [Candidatus Vicinibacter affinis]